MSSIEVIEALKTLPENEYREVLDFIFGPDDEEVLRISLERCHDIDTGKAQGLSREEMIKHARAALK